MKRLALVACAVSAMGAFAVSEMTSGNTFIYVDTAESSFWRTATNNTVALSIDYPATATSASLTVAGAYGYSVSFTDVPEGRFARLHRKPRMFTTSRLRSTTEPCAPPASP